MTDHGSMPPSSPASGNSRNIEKLLDSFIAKFDQSAGRPLDPGTEVGSYRIERCLGRGSMGIVYLCQLNQDNKARVALKVLDLSLDQSPEIRRYFDNEILISTRINHQNVIHPFEVIRGDRFLAYSMQYISGGDLEKWLMSQNNLPVTQALNILIQICAGVQAMHALAVVHRDLKPSNVLLTEDGEVRISDFALARPQTLKRLSSGTGIVGTIDYLSPEYIEHSRISPSCDIYAIGAIAFELFTGVVPFAGHGLYETISRKLNQEAPLAHEINPHCPTEISALIARALRRDPDARPRTVEEFSRELARLAASPNIPRQIVLAGRDVFPVRLKTTQSRLRSNDVDTGEFSTKVLSSMRMMRNAPNLKKAFSLVVHSASLRRLRRRSKIWKLSVSVLLLLTTALLAWMLTKI